MVFFLALPPPMLQTTSALLMVVSKTEEKGRGREILGLGGNVTECAIEREWGQASASFCNAAGIRPTFRLSFPY